MSTRAVHASLFRSLLTRPGPALAQALARATDAGELPLEVTRRLMPFPERVADLSLEEMQELHDETFGQVDEARPCPPEDGRAERPAFLDAPSAAALGAAKSRIEALLWDWAGNPDATGATLGELRDLADSVDAALAAARNPYSYVFASLGVLLRDA